MSSTAARSEWMAREIPTESESMSVSQPAPTQEEVAPIRNTRQMAEAGFLESRLEMLEHGQSA
jgi:hypothetical protein